jgi:hypothetical protein
MKTREETKKENIRKKELEEKESEERRKNEENRLSLLKRHRTNRIGEDGLKVEPHNRSSNIFNKPDDSQEENKQSALEEKDYLPKLYLILSKAIIMKFHSQYHNLYIIVINTMRKFFKDLEFIKILFETSLDILTEMVILNDRQLNLNIILNLCKIINFIQIFYF